MGWLEHNRKVTEYRDNGEVVGKKTSRKNKREHVAPQSGIQMLFVVLCSLRSTELSYASH